MLVKIIKNLRSNKINDDLLQYDVNIKRDTVVLKNRKKKITQITFMLYKISKRCLLDNLCLKNVLKISYAI